MVDKHFLWRAAVTEALVLISITLESVLTGWLHKPQDPRVKIPLFLFFSPAATGHMHLMVSLRKTACFSSWSVLQRAGCQTTPPQQQTNTSPCGPQPWPPGHLCWDAEQGPSLPPGTRGGTFLLPSPVPGTCALRGGRGCSFCLTRGEHVTAWERPQA